MITALAHTAPLGETVEKTTISTATTVPITVSTEPQWLSVFKMFNNRPRATFYRLGPLHDRWRYPDYGQLESGTRSASAVTPT